MVNQAFVMFSPLSLTCNRDLYLLSLTELYKQDAKDTSSFFQIAGTVYDPFTLMDKEQS